MALVYPNGKAFQAERMKNFLTYQELGQIADLPGTDTVRNIEKGRPCRIDTFRKLMKALDIDFSEAHRFMISNEQQDN
jgi:predicted transcriptional regulator